jgi:hypothetical protein
MDNPLKTESSVTHSVKKATYSKKRNNGYNPQFSKTTTNNLMRGTKSPQARLGSTQNIDTGLRKIPQLNKNHSVSNLRGGRMYKSTKRPYWRKKPQQNGADYFLSPYVAMDPFLKNLKKIPKLRVMRKQGNNRF